MLELSVKGGMSWELGRADPDWDWLGESLFSSFWTEYATGLVLDSTLQQADRNSF